MRGSPAIGKIDRLRPIRGPARSHTARCRGLTGPEKQPPQERRHSICPREAPDSIAGSEELSTRKPSADCGPAGPARRDPTVPKRSARGRTSCQIRVSASADGGSAFLRVADQGAGIPPSERERVLDRLVRLPSVSEVPGTGLGLSIARSLVEMNGGKLRLAGAQGGGVLFEIELPLVAA